jgi:CDP-diacylglycerol--glycerol-3-phosphate 3-phosphatidyltransferase
MRKIENIFTGARIVGSFIMPFILVADIPRLIPFISYILFALTDIVDGFISRRRKNGKNNSNSSGDILDPVADKMLFISSLITLIYVQKIPLFASVIITLREIFILGLRAIAERYKIHIKSSILAKLKTFTGNVAVSAYILKDEYFGISAQTVGDIFIILCFILSIISGAEYITFFQKEKRKISK